MKKIHPLKMSLDFLDMRIVEFSEKLGIQYPEILEDLQAQREELCARWTKLSSDAESIQREFGEERWVALLIDSGNQARKLMSGLEQQMAALLDISSSTSVKDSPAPLSSSQRLQLYENTATEKIPEILKVLGLLERAAHDKVTTSIEVAREIAHLKNFWVDFEEHIGEIDQKYGLDIAKVISRHSFRDSRSRASQRSSSMMSFRGSRSRSRSCSAASSIASIAEPNSPNRLESSSPFEEDPCMRTPMPLHGKKTYDLCTPIGDRKSSQLDIRVRKLQATPHSAIPVAKRSARTSTTASVALSNIARPQTPSDRRRRVSSIPQAVYAVPPLPPALPDLTHANAQSATTPRATSFAAPTLSSMLKQKPSTLDLQKKSSAFVVSPQKKQSSPSTTPSSKIGTSEITRKVRKKSMIPQTPQPGKLNSEASTVRSTSQTAARQSSAGAKDPFQPTSVTTLNHHASTPNLVRKASSTKLVTGVVKKIPPVPALPRTPASKATPAAAKGFKLESASTMSPNSQKKFYITYGSGDEETADAANTPAAKVPRAVAGSKTLSSKKSMSSMSVQKPRWR